MSDRATNDERGRETRAAEAAALALRLEQTQSALRGLAERVVELERDRRILHAAMQDANQQIRILESSRTFRFSKWPRRLYGWIRRRAGR